MIRMVISDIDGTLLPFGDDHIANEIHEAIDTLKAAGIEFCPASGRPPTDIDLAFKDTTTKMTSVASDGIIVIADGTLVTEKPLPNDEVQRVADALKNYDKAALAVVFNEDDDPLGHLAWNIISPSEQGYEALKTQIKYGMQPPILEKVPNHKMYVASLFGRPNNEALIDVRNIVDEASEHLHILNSSPGVFDLVQRTWTKSKGVQAMLDYRGYTEDEVVFFGDANNDIPLFEMFENSFCVACGTEEAKAAAHWVIPDPLHEGPEKVMVALAEHKGDLEAVLKALNIA